MKVVNLSEQNTVMNRFLAEIRDEEYQKNQLVFRNNIERIGMCMAYEISRQLTYETTLVKTPLGEASVPVPADPMIVATVLRAGLPFHHGFLHFFDHAESAFISAFRMYKNRAHTEVGVHTEYMASPCVEGKTLLIVDPMLATGGSMAAAYEAFLKTGKPKSTHIAVVIGTEEGLDVIRQAVGDDDVTVWCAAIDPGMNDHKYIVPGFGDCGDLCYGKKL